MHHFGLACDFCKIADVRANWSGDWALLGRLARAKPLVWGGDWGDPCIAHGFKDLDHVQPIAVKNQPRLFAGEWYPDADLHTVRHCLISRVGSGSVSARFDPLVPWA